ncbi:UNVERIFIED_CONTAM: hypothetical protein PYX00_006258 [Menopon gallinae]|uniref:Uncharacterized protein n=1 Tax=Menopon gallinae TaxID=328185 RepID=A0AAW2HVI9_9NEOP
MQTNNGFLPLRYIYLFLLISFLYITLNDSRIMKGAILQKNHHKKFHSSGPGYAHHMCGCGNSGNSINTTFPNIGMLQYT